MRLFLQFVSRAFLVFAVIMGLLTFLLMLA